MKKKGENSKKKHGRACNAGQRMSLELGVCQCETAAGVHTADGIKRGTGGMRGREKKAVQFPSLSKAIAQAQEHGAGAASGHSGHCRPHWDMKALAHHVALHAVTPGGCVASQSCTHHLET
eukprot:1149106-Pelagomonas_calceolata.AAC.2